MNAQYYYVDPESQRTHGPFSLDDIRSFHEHGLLDRTTPVCRVVAEEWRSFDACPELMPPVEAPALPAVSAPAPPPGEPAAGTSLIPGFVAAAVCGLVLAAGVTWPKLVPTAVPLVATAKSPAPPPSPPLPPTPVPAPIPEATPTPTPPPEGDAGRGTEIAHRILDQYPKLKVAVVSGITFQKPDGIELYGKGAFGASICFILPEEAWTALSEQEKLDLKAYVAGKVAWVRDHAEDYLIIPKNAPDYGQNLELARHLVDGAWRIGSTQVYLDDLDRNLYFKRVLDKGPAY